MVTCAQFEDAASELSLGQVPEPERSALLDHAAGCGSCRTLLDELGALADRLLLLAPEVEPPAGFDARVLATIAPRRTMRRAVVAAAVLLLAAVGGVVGIARVGSDAPDVRSAVVVGRTGDPIGTLEVEADPARVVLTLEGPATWRGTWTCELRTATGTWVEVGSWTAADIVGEVWTTSIDSSLVDAVVMRVRNGRGDVIATAALRAP